MIMADTCLLAWRPKNFSSLFLFVPTCLRDYAPRPIPIHAVCTIHAAALFSPEKHRKRLPSFKSARVFGCVG